MKCTQCDFSKCCCLESREMTKAAATATIMAIDLLPAPGMLPHRARLNLISALQCPFAIFELVDGQYWSIDSRKAAGRLDASVSNDQVVRLLASRDDCSVYDLTCTGALRPDNESVLYLRRRLQYLTKATVTYEDYEALGKTIKGQVKYIDPMKGHQVLRILKRKVLETYFRNNEQLYAHWQKQCVADDHDYPSFAEESSTDGILIELSPNTRWVNTASFERTGMWNSPTSVDVATVARRLSNKRPRTLRGIARIHMQLEALHPFVDYNTRTNHIHLNRLVLQAGFGPGVLLYDPFQVHFATVDEWAQTIATGIAKWCALFDLCRREGYSQRDLTRLILTGEITYVGLGSQREY